MKKVVKLEGLDCPNCARSLQEEINKLGGVKNAEINFVKSTLSFESENPETALQNIVELTKRLEPQARIYEKSAKSAKNAKKLVFDIACLVVGVALGVVLFFVKMPKPLFWVLYVAAALILGYKTYYKAITQLFRGIINENLLLTISVIGATFVSEHLEGLMVIALYGIGKIFEGLAVDKTRKAISMLAQMQPEFAVILKHGQECRVSPEEVPVGSVIVVRPGEKVALDGVITSGSSAVDMQSLTGESVPVALSKGAEILSGSVVLDGVLTIKTTKEFKSSTTSKIMELVENAAENKSKTETFISKITKWYTLGVVLCALLVWGIFWAVTKNFNAAIYKGLIFLVVSCPCAFAISVPLAYFSGLGNASKHGILIKGSNHLDVCARLKTVVFDKTGTLTTGQFQVEKISAKQGITEKQVLFLASIGEQNSLHPLAKAIVSACGKKRLPKAENLKEIAGKGVEFEYGGKKYFVGRKSKNLESTAVELFEGKEKLGQIDLKDSIKTSSAAACGALKKMGVRTVMLSGDNKMVVQSVAQEVGIDEALFGLLPQDKFNWLQSHKTKQQNLAYVGDGLNDAPSLTLADVSISMGINGSPASIEASDIVLVDDEPQKIVSAIKISKYTRKIVLENIVFSAAVKLAFVILGLTGVTGHLAMLAAVFADVGVTVLAILNSIRALAYKPEKAKAKHKK